MKAKVLKKMERRDGSLGQWAVIARGEVIESTSTHVRVKTFPQRKGEAGVDEWFAIDSERIRTELEPITLTDPSLSREEQPIKINRS